MRPGPPPTSASTRPTPCPRRSSSPTSISMCATARTSCAVSPPPSRGIRPSGARSKLDFIHSGSLKKKRVVFQKWRWPLLYRPSKSIAVDKQANDDIVHLRRFREADRLADEAFDARPEREIAAPDKFEGKCSERAVTAPAAYVDLNLLIPAQTFQVLLLQALLPLCSSCKGLM